jgi:hypothetical protein
MNIQTSGVEADILSAEVCESITKRTMEKMIYRPNESYKSFATDIIPLILPVLYNRRHRLGVPCMLRSNPVVDVLMTVPAIKKYHPTAGVLRVEISDLKHTHHSSRDLLEILHTEGCMVKRVGGGDSKHRLAYIIDPQAWWNLKTKYQAVMPL